MAVIQVLLVLGCHLPRHGFVLQGEGQGKPLMPTE